MPITVNQNMVNFIADDDTIDGFITVSANVDPGNLIQEVGELLGINFDPNTTPIPDYDIATLRDVIIELWDDLIAREIVYVADEENADSTINRVSNLPASVGGVTYSTLDSPLFPDDIDVFLPNLDILPNMPAALPTAAWGTALHEFGHALRLRHPGPYNASDDGAITYANNRLFDEDMARYSIMSYFEPDDYGSAVAARWFGQQTLTPMIYDILAIQQLYGVDTTTRTDDTTYGFNGNANRAIFNFTTAGIGTFMPVMTIWDAGGRDRLDFSKYDVNQRIDLTSGSYSDVGQNAFDGLTGNFGFAFDTWIEEAIGGAGDDVITGNDLDNLLDGGPAAIRSAHPTTTLSSVLEATTR